jgi:predicted MFS family arabinose efflux permease
MNAGEQRGAQTDRRDLLLIYAAAFLRSSGVGVMGVLLGVYLARAGLSASSIGVVIAAGLVGTSAATALIGWKGDRLGRRITLIIFALFTAAGGAALALTTRAAILLPLAVLGMINGTGTDRSAAFAMEQAVIPGLTTAKARTWSLSWYNVVLDGSGAMGALAAGAPAMFHARLGIAIGDAYRLAFAAFALANLAAAVLYACLSERVEVARPRQETAPVSERTRKIVRNLAALFAIDAFGGGFLTDALVAYWFFQRFGVSVQALGVVFAVVHVLNALSHLGAAWLAQRIGLLNTMVFTHLPSSVFLILVPLAPNFYLAAGLFFLREALVEMDVPSRQSYVAAVVEPRERTFASGVTNLTRNLMWAAGSSVAGVFMQNVAFSAPLVAGGSIKVLYDALLYRAFRTVKPPEEQKNL